MKYHTWNQGGGGYPICLLVQEIRDDELQRAYLDPFNLNPDGVLVIEQHRNPEVKKTSQKEIKAWIQEELKEVLTEQQVKYLVVDQAEYFKVLTKQSNAEPWFGYVMDSIYGDFKVIYVPSFRSIFYDPDKRKAQIKLGFDALISHALGQYEEPGTGIIGHARYPKYVQEIQEFLDYLLTNYTILTADIEGFGLKHYDSGIGTIAFAWNEREGGSFPIDLLEEGSGEARHILRDFFIKFRAKGGKLIWHHISFDVYVLIYQLFMDDLLDTEGLLRGMDILLHNWDDTKLITYLATNSCAGNDLGLKAQAQEYAGNYAVEEIKDITKIPLPDLLQYNLVDALSTWYVYNKHYQTMVNDQQLEIYETIFKPAIKDIVQMQLTGLPVNMEKVHEVKAVLESDEAKALTKIRYHPVVSQYIAVRNERWVIERNAKLKKKQVTLADANETFNPGSNDQLAEVLYDLLGLPVLERTNSGAPGTGQDVIKKLRAYTEDPTTLSFLEGLIEYAEVSILLSTFIPAFLRARQGPDGWHYLFGNFNLGGTVSGRLSSNGPNLQNLPATGSRYAKLIKTIFSAPLGWLFVGLDFASLEDRISALTTKDPQKLKVYTDGYDGHCLRAHAYFGDRMPDIDPSSVESINSIKDKYPAERQNSKVPTFSLTYAGTFITIMASCGFTRELAQQIERNYHVLYAHSDKWVADKLDAATRDGYVTVAFGLRVRTPLLAQVIRGVKGTPHEANAEGRTAGNALGQSWCLLNSRAGSEFMGKVRDSEYRLDIKPCAQIHDANYLLIRDDLDVLMYTNEHLVKAAEWQDHPDIRHPDVGLGGEVSIFYPDWSKEIVIPNGATKEIIEQKISKHMEKLAA
ncbi:DNA polymerase I protein [Rhizobium phage RHph_Y2_6]|uniref:DNA polymerase I protein n=1 Tax=Rhizobium phage RHph_Y2_6 TaxID=2509576 RepID=A0A7S5UTN6_9CAUD|nr:DNA polymerase I protein [Rhizobium phage RHph_Y2_6]QIG68799.1 DNA polymerase I protein [Rhizobium phage RHph_Y2_6]